MLDKVSIARLLNKNVGASNGELLQFFRSPLFKEDEHENELIESFLKFRKQLNEELEEFKDWSINDTFLKGVEYTTLKIPKKVLKQMELNYLETKAYIESVIKEINNQD